MASKMKSFRFSEDYAYDLRNIAQALEVTETAALELCIEWFYQSGARFALESVDTPLKRTMRNACQDGEISQLVHSKTRQ